MASDQAYGFSGAPQSRASSIDSVERPMRDVVEIAEFHHPSSAELLSPEGALRNPPRSLTFLNGLALVIGLQIGSGIFSAPSVVRSHVPTSTSAILVWILAGLLVWTGAASFTELGISVPENGGIQEYLRHCYGDVYGFLFAWMWIIIVKPCAMAMIALVFSEYLYKALSSGENISTWVVKSTALLSILFITYLNCLGTRVGTGTATVFLALKLVGLASVAVLGLAFAIGGFEHETIGQPSLMVSRSWTSSPLPQAFELHGSSLWTALGSYTDAMFAALFAYGGWESIGFVAGEITDPANTLPRILNGAMAIVITLFAMANMAFYSYLSEDLLRETNAVASTFGAKLLGHLGALFYTWVVCLSCLGALNATVFSAGRLTQAAAKRHYLPAFLQSRPEESYRNDRNPYTLIGWMWRFARLPKDQNVPVNAMILNGCLASVFVLIGSFRGLLSFIGMAEYIVFFCTVLGVFALRTRSRSVAGSSNVTYRTWTLNPIIFCIVSGSIAARNAVTHVVQAVIVFLFFGTLFYIYKMRWWQSHVMMTSVTNT